MEKPVIVVKTPRQAVEMIKHADWVPSKAEEKVLLAWIIQSNDSLAIIDVLPLFTAKQIVASMKKHIKNWSAYEAMLVLNHIPCNEQYRAPREALLHKGLRQPINNWFIEQKYATIWSEIELLPKEAAYIIGVVTRSRSSEFVIRLRTLLGRHFTKEQMAELDRAKAKFKEAEHLPKK